MRVDGATGEWRDPARVHVDAAGDGRAGGMDFLRIGASVGPQGLVLMVEAQQPFDFFSSNLMLYLDTDGDISTGQQVFGIGADIFWNSAKDEGQFLPGGAILPRREFFDEVLPVGLSDRFEILIPLSLLPNVQPGGRIGVLFRSGGIGDMAPDPQQTFHIDVPPGLQGAAALSTLDRVAPTDIRIASWNTLLWQGPNDSAAKEASLGRILQATRPDIIHFQEVRAISTTWMQSFVEKWLPLEEGRWYLAKYDGVITASRFEILKTWGRDRNLITWKRTRDELGFDLVTVNAHTPCCDDQAGRKFQTDNFMRLLRLLIRGEETTAPAGAFAIMVLGDLNANAPQPELTTVRNGWFSNAALRPLNFWPDARHDRPLVSVSPRHTHSRRLFTWRSPTTAGTQRLDYIFYEESRLTNRRSYAVDSTTMPAAFLEQHALSLLDTEASDHFLLIADFAPRSIDFGWWAVDHVEAGWFHSRWLGWLFRQGGAFHFSPLHANVHALPAGDGFWIWDAALGWWYSRGELYPFAYIAEPGSWSYFGTAADGARIIFNYSEARWELNGTRVR